MVCRITRKLVPKPMIAFTFQALIQIRLALYSSISVRRRLKLRFSQSIGTRQEAQMDIISILFRCMGDYKGGLHKSHSELL